MRKLALYFRPVGSYWRLVDHELRANPGSKALGFWPLSVAPRLDQGHFQRFDDRGLPLKWIPSMGGWVHQYCTMTAFALANWERFLQTGSETNLRSLLSVADYLVESAERPSPDLVLFRVEIRGQGHVGFVSAMDHGEAMSVLCRAWQVTNQTGYLDTAVGCARAFDLPVEKGGFVDRISENGALWYEETPGSQWSHVLNGMIYALWGLRDLHTVTGLDWVKSFLDDGLSSVQASLPLFDTGYWSLYHLPKSGQKYVASMMYHELHICQLTDLARYTGDATFQLYAQRFTDYARRWSCRLRAGLAIGWSKVRQRFVSRPPSAATAVSAIDQFRSSNL
ncbi:MAG: D-glucuronyl C5-epimerase family protein [Gemmataceae bacterium]|nr:D-glucuronyl C5-epimerase family protein [Gemmataceae bacterium]